MPHHWRPSDHLERSPQPGVWLLVRRGKHLGSVEYGRVQRRPAFRGVTPAGTVVGYARSLERACDRLWEWSIRTGAAMGLTAWPWPPIQVAEGEWVVMRNSPSLPKAVIRLLPATDARASVYRVVTWAPLSGDRKLIGYYPTLDAADEAVLEDAPAHMSNEPDRR